MTDRIEPLREALKHPNVLAFLRVIRRGEGTEDDLGYSRLFGGEQFEPLNAHPRKVIEKGRYRSTAAGAYQILARTYDGLVAQYGFADFYPGTQDLMAVALIIGRKALPALLAGRLEAAVRLCAREWASLPGSPYGQPIITMTEARRIYEQYGGQYAPQPAVPKEQPMAPFIAAALPTLIQAIPELAKTFGSGSQVSERNAKAAETVLRIAQEAVGASNAQETAEIITQDPGAAQSARAAVLERWYEIVEVGEGGIEGARQFSAQAAREAPFWRLPAIWITAAILPLLYGVVWIVLTGAPDVFSRELRAAIASSVVTGIMGGVLGFWLGSSSSSQKKDEVIARRT